MSLRAIRRSTLPLLVIAALGAVGALVERAESLGAARRALQRDYASATAFPGTRTVGLLAGLGVLHPVPEAKATREDRRALRERRRDRPTDPWLGSISFFGVDRTTQGRLPSSELPGDAHDSEAPILSLAVADHDLRWILGRPLARGRAAERSAFVTYFEGGRPRFASGAGVRIHGGRSRLGSAAKSFRLYFRDTYGAALFAPSRLFRQQPEPFRRLVVHNDVRHDIRGREWHFANPLAYDVARRIGALAPRARPVRLYVNGRPQGGYVLTEYLDASFLERHFGHDRFVFVRTKRDRGGGEPDPRHQEAAEALREWARTGPAMDEVAERVDLDNLTSWFLSILFCGTTDMFQGPLLRDRTRPDARWFWILWDMDHSFMSAAVDSEGPAWEEDIFDRVLRGPKRDPRVLLLRGLLRRDAAYRRYFLDRYAEARADLVASGFLAERVAHYARVADQIGLEETSFLASLREFVERRPAALDAEVERHFRELPRLTSPTTPAVILGPHRERG